MPSAVTLVVTCTKRKAEAVPRDLQLRGVPGDDLSSLARAWIERLSRTGATTAAHDLYQGDQVPAGHKSLALRFRFRHFDRSLTDEEVDGYMGNVISAVKEAGYDIRE